MARYTGPKHKLARREGVNILDKSSASLQRRLNIPPGVHGRKGKRRPSEFGTQLREKQKAKAMYGLLEKQFARLVKSVESQKGDSGELLLSLLETRLDNLVYRSGFAKTRFMARQMVSHGHVFIDGKRMSIPSYQVKIFDTITFSKDFLVAIPEDFVLPSWLSFNKKDNSVKILANPKREDVQESINEQLVIEFYSR